MLLIFVLLFLMSIALSGITTIPLSIPLLIVCAVVFRKSWIFFGALGLGLILDLFLLRSLGQTGLFFVFLIFTIFLYERKFETQTVAFVFFATFLGSFFYLWFFKYDNVLLQSFASAVIGIMFFRVILSKAKDLDSSLQSE